MTRGFFILQDERKTKMEKLGSRSGERCKLLEWGLEPPTILVYFEGEGTLLVAFKMHGFKQQKTAFTYIL